MLGLTLLSLQEEIGQRSLFLLLQHSWPRTNWLRMALFIIIPNCLNGEEGPRGLPSHEALSVLPQGALEISSVVGQPPSLDRNHFNTPRVVPESHKHDERCKPSSQRPQYPTLYRRLKRRLGCSLRVRKKGYT